MIEVKRKGNCCGKPMRHMKPFSALDGTEIERWICEECGCFYEFSAGQYDQEVLENILENET